MAKPIVITTGDPAGIGPEIILKLSTERIFLSAVSVVIGRKALYEETASKLHLHARIVKIKKASEARKGFLCVLEPESKNEYGFGVGPGKSSATEAIAYLDTALEIWNKEGFAAMVTAPLSKEKAASVRENFSGHTYYLADATGVKRGDAVMLFVSNSIKTALVTQHAPLSAVPSAISKDAVIRTTVNAVAAVKSLGLDDVRTAVCSLNPHAGEGGLLGREEIDEISPAIDELKGKGLDVYGPVSSETAVADALKNRTSLIIAMYHDQGLAPVKLFSHGRGVNMTWGLPFPRFSPLHGVAFDIAGAGEAAAASMIEAFRFACTAGASA